MYIYNLPSDPIITERASIASHVLDDNIMENALGFDATLMRVFNMVWAVWRKWKLTVAPMIKSQ